MTQKSLLLMLCAVPAQTLLLAQSYSVSTLAGTTVIKDGIPAVQAFIRSPEAVQIDSKGNIYVLDDLANQVRRIDPKGVISTIARDGTFGFAGDGGPASSAKFNQPYDLALDNQGLNLYIADTGNNRIRKVDLTTGIITTIAGNGSSTSSGDNGPALEAGS